MKRHRIAATTPGRIQGSSTSERIRPLVGRRWLRSSATTKPMTFWRRTTNTVQTIELRTIWPKSPLAEDLAVELEADELGIGVDERGRVEALDRRPDHRVVHQHRDEDHRGREEDPGEPAGAGFHLRPGCCRSSALRGRGELLRWPRGFAHVRAQVATHRPWCGSLLPLPEVRRRGGPRGRIDADQLLVQRVDRGAGLGRRFLRVHAGEDVLGERHLDVGDLEVARRERARGGVVELLHDPVRALAVGLEEGVGGLDVGRDEVDHLAVDVLAGEELDELPGRLLVGRVGVHHQVPAAIGADRRLALGRGAVDEVPVDLGLLQRRLLERRPELDGERAVEEQFAHVAGGGIGHARRRIGRERGEIGERADRLGAGQPARAVVVEHLAAVREDERVHHHHGVLALVGEEADAELAVGGVGQLLAGRLQALEGGDRGGVDAGGLEQVVVVERELPDIDVERDAPQLAVIVGRAPGAGEEGVGGDAGALRHVVERLDRAGRGEGRDPDLVDGRDVRRVAALHGGEQPLLVLGIGDGRDLDLDAGVLGLERLHRLLLVLAEAGFGLLVVPELQDDVLGMGRGRQHQADRGREHE